MSLLGRLDWVSKKWLLQMFIDEEKVDWKDPWLLSLDLEYHNINANRGLYYDLENTGVAHRVLTEAQVDRACSEPPKDTRAKARSEVIRALAETRVRYIVDWDSVYLENEHHLSFKDPFETYESEVESFLKEIRSATPSAAPTVRRRLR